MKSQFLKMAACKSEKEFYKKFPTESAFFEAFPQAIKYKKQGGENGFKPYSMISQTPVAPFGEYYTGPIGAQAFYQEGGVAGDPPYPTEVPYNAARTQAKPLGPFGYDQWINLDPFAKLSYDSQFSPPQPPAEMGQNPRHLYGPDIVGYKANGDPIYRQFAQEPTATSKPPVTSNIPGEEYNINHIYGPDIIGYRQDGTPIYKQFKSENQTKQSQTFYPNPKGTQITGNNGKPQGKPGSDKTRELQQKLNSMGATLVVDGKWGPKTQAAYDKYMGNKPTTYATDTEYQGKLRAPMGEMQMGGTHDFTRIPGASPDGSFMPMQQRSAPATNPYFQPTGVGQPLYNAQTNQPIQIKGKPPVPAQYQYPGGYAIYYKSLGLDPQGNPLHQYGGIYENDYGYDEGMIMQKGGNKQDATGNYDQLSIREKKNMEFLSNLSKNFMTHMANQEVQNLMNQSTYGIPKAQMGWQMNSQEQPWMNTPGTQVTSVDQTGMFSSQLGVDVPNQPMLNLPPQDYWNMNSQVPAGGPASQQQVQVTDSNPNVYSSQPGYRKEYMNVNARPQFASREARADAMLTGAAFIGSNLDKSQDRKLQRKTRNGMSSDMFFNSVPNNSSSRGDYNPNSGMFRPDQMVPNQFTGYGSMGYKSGGEYYLDDNEIQQFLAMGGSIEYID